MADWIAEIDRIESDLSAAGVPAADAMRVAAMFADALAQADKAKRDAERRKLAHTVALCQRDGTRVASERLGITPQAVRKRCAKWFNKFATGTD